MKTTLIKLRKYIIFIKYIRYLKALYIIFNIIKISQTIHNKFNKKKIGVIGLNHSQNIGNNLLKYAIFIKLSELGFDPYIVGKRNFNQNISFLQKYTKIKLIKSNFREIKINDFDILIVNSDQTWRKWDEYFYDIAFLKFAEKWNKKKLVYATSLGVNKWEFNEKDEKIAKYLIKKFNGISVREKGSIKLIENHLGIKPLFVLDPTLLINKRYYLKIIKNFKNEELLDNKCLFVYLLNNITKINNFIKNISSKLNYKIFFVNVYSENQIKNFIYGIYHCKAVITDSYHGTLFSIIFNKPFISFSPVFNGIERFNTLKEVFNLYNRIFDCNYSSVPDINLLKINININKNPILNLIKKQSLNYLKKKLGVKF